MENTFNFAKVNLAFGKHYQRVQRGQYVTKLQRVWQHWSFEKHQRPYKAIKCIKKQTISIQLPENIIPAAAPAPKSVFLLVRVSCLYTSIYQGKLRSRRKLVKCINMAFLCKASVGGWSLLQNGWGLWLSYSGSHGYMGFGYPPLCWVIAFTEVLTCLFLPRSNIWAKVDDAQRAFVGLKDLSTGFDDWV